MRQFRVTELQDAFCHFFPFAFCFAVVQRTFGQGNIKSLSSFRNVYRRTLPCGSVCKSVWLKGLEDFSALGVDFSDSLFLIEVIYVGGETGAKRYVLLVHALCVLV